MANTTNYNITKPDVGGSENTWGTTINTGLDTIDSTIKTVSDSVPTSIVSSNITDTPNSLGTAKQVLRVNSSANATEFATPSILDLSDTPSSIGASGQVLKVNSGGTALEFADDASGGGGITLAQARSGLSHTQNSASGNGSFSYSASTGVMTYTPPNLSGFASSTNGTAVRAGYVQGYSLNSPFNQVGTYIWASGTIGNTSTEYSNGADAPGSSIYPAGAISYDSGGGNVAVDVSSSSLGSGTWKAMGQIKNLATSASGNYMQHRHTLWLRII